jgi:hypothetical protein
MGRPKKKDEKWCVQIMLRRFFWTNTCVFCCRKIGSTTQKSTKVAADKQVLDDVVTSFKCGHTHVAINQTSPPPCCMSTHKEEAVDIGFEVSQLSSFGSVGSLYFLPCENLTLSHL